MGYIVENQIGVSDMSQSNAANETASATAGRATALKRYSLSSTAASASSSFMNDHLRSSELVNPQMAKNTAVRAKKPGTFRYASLCSTSSRSSTFEKRSGC